MHNEIFCSQDSLPFVILTKIYLISICLFCLILDSNDLLIKEALSILNEKLTSDQIKDLKEELKLKNDVSKWQVEWKIMKPQLQFIGRDDLIEEIQMKTDITIGIKTFARICV